MEEDQGGGSFFMTRVPHVAAGRFINSFLQLILPYLQLDIKYFDLGLEYRDQVGGFVRLNPCI